MKFFFIVSLLFSFKSFAEPIKIEFWHSLAGPLGIALNQVVDEYNQRQSDYKIEVVYKGEYSESLTSFAAAFRAKKAPAIIQVFEAGTTSMLNPPGIIKPVYELMLEQGLSLPEKNFLPAVLNLYSQGSQLQAMPFNISIPVIFYNQDVLEALGVMSFPKTWSEMEALAEKLRKAGFPCAYTSAYPAWIHIESFSRIHGLSLIDKTFMKTAFNNQAILNHLKRLKRWQMLHYFEYGGRASEATSLFTSGHCPLFSQSSGSYESLSKTVTFKVGVALMPLDLTLSTERYNNLAGGGALWVVAGQTAVVNKGIANFFVYLAKPETQEQWLQHTGYLPLGLEGEYVSINTKATSPLLKLAKEDLNNKSIYMPANFLAQAQIRMIVDEAFEAIFAGIKSPKEALDDAEEKANFKMMRFRQNNL